MDNLLEEILSHLRALVAFDTRNPPRDIHSGGVCAYLAQRLEPDFQVRIEDLGAGSVNVLAVRGRPRLLFNFHLDTVPDSEGWTRDPFDLLVSGGRATGLGACDIKGAAAAMLAAVRRSDGPAALLFSTDEEGSDGVCINHYLQGRPGFDGVVVAEPTLNRAILAHRGFASMTARFNGVPGHGSAERALTSSAVHEAVRWCSRALDHAGRCNHLHSLGMTGIRLNIGVFEGGRKSNMIAGEAVVRLAFRPPPGVAPEQVEADLKSLAENPDRVCWERGQFGPSLPAADAARPDGLRPVEKAEALARRLGMQVAAPVDFWSEAALFSASGLPALVYGPGDIAQAHTDDEWVALPELKTAAETYIRILDEEARGG
ncbi:MAG: Acetylornithine deacetylase [Myxococcota bacterium]|nr:Acetylornithine deacetylase [Myxococcota bacterium]